jgi:NodT family efflux transporter outer membrane factor (OMF) lipoprotein
MATHMNSACKPRRGFFLVFLLAGLPGGCAVGPNFARPAPPQIKGYAAHPLTAPVGTPNVAGGQAQHFVEGIDIPGQWWTLFHSKPLNALIERALANNPNIKAAQAALTVAHENVLAQRGVYYPSVAAGFAASRDKIPNLFSPFETTNSATGFAYYSLFTPQVTVSYTPDVFGLNRRTGESLQAQEQAVRFAAVATYITLSANVAGAAIQEASLRAQIAATQQLVKINSDLLEIVRFQFDKGAASRVEVAAQEAQLAQVAAALPPLRKQLAQQRDLLAVLAGGFPSEQPPETFELSTLQLPESLPLSLPSQLVEHRPDVRQAEENLHAASAQIGIAIANRLPNLSLTADAGSIATAATRMFARGTGFWDLGLNLAQPLFDAGMLLHQERAARAAYVEAAQQYRGTVLTAFQNVADTLSALEEDAQALKAASASEMAAKASLELIEQQLKFGLVAYSSLLSGEQAYQQASIGLVQAQASRYADTVALFQALGGGWWNHTAFARNEHE